MDVNKELDDAIERECKRIGIGRRRCLGANDERRRYRHRQEYTLSNQRREIDDGPQLCDCPYWGTEFNE